MQHLATIRDQNIIVTATDKGKLPFVSADDVAAVGFRALTDEKAHNTDHLILGPELLSYDQVCPLFLLPFPPRSMLNVTNTLTSRLQPSCQRSWEE